MPKNRFYKSGFTGCFIILYILCVVFSVCAQSLYEANQFCLDEAPNTVEMRDIKDIENVLRAHKQWVYTNGRDGIKANLEYANLKGLDLSGVNLSKANLYKANLTNTKLSKATLDGTVLNCSNLKKADLTGASLVDAFLKGANLEEAVLSSANLSNTSLEYANLSKALFFGAQLNNTKLNAANMFNAQLQNSRLSAISIDVEANFSEADFEQAILKDINIKNLNAVGASMVGAELINATIDNSDFSSSKFYQAKLNNTIIKNSSLIESVFIDTEFIDVSFEGSKLDRAIYNPKIYENINLSKASGLSSLNFSDASPVRYLEKRAKEIGLIREDRALSAALRKYYISDLPIYEKVFEYFLFDFFTDSGENPFKPFFILIVSILPFSLIYIKALSCKTEDGIFKVWLKERIRKDLGINNPEKVKFKKITDIKTAFYFSFLSAFSIGWKELNVRYWIELIQCREYSLRATGWVRTVSGIQSLFSVYLLAMWALTYFGRPFEFYFGS